MSRKLLIELTENEAETLADSIADYVSYLHDSFDQYSKNGSLVNRYDGEISVLKSMQAVICRGLACLKNGKRYSMIEWHKYPDEKPTKTGWPFDRYLVAVVRRFSTTKVKRVIFSEWGFDDFLNTYPDDDDSPSDHVIAWSKAPAFPSED